VIKAKTSRALSKAVCIINDLERDISLNDPVGSKTVGLWEASGAFHGSEDHVWFEDRWMVASLCDE
jgi:hypothetical protein